MSYKWWNELMNHSQKHTQQNLKNDQRFYCLFMILTNDQ